MAKPKNLNGGRPPLPADKRAEIVAMIGGQTPPAEIARVTGVSLAKVYEIRRHITPTLTTENEMAPEA